MPAASQEGHPLAGTWYGEWGPGGQGNQVTMFLSWEGGAVNGFMMNPGPQRTPLTVVLDSSEWSVHIESGEDGSEDSVRHVADGILENVGSRRRTLSGTWNADGTNYEFTITRED